MSSGPSFNVTNGMPEDQISIDQMTSELTARENEKRIAIELEPVETDFLVAPNGKAVPKTLRKWIGRNKRDSLLRAAENTLLKNAINQLYRPGSFIGDGGTSAVIKFEKATGIGLGRNGNTHVQKGRELLHYINTKILSQSDLSAGDRKLAQKLAHDLENALRG